MTPNSFSNKPGLIYKAVSESRQTCGLVRFKLNQVAVGSGGWDLTGCSKLLEPQAQGEKPGGANPAPLPIRSCWQGCRSRARERGRPLQRQDYK